MRVVGNGGRGFGRARPSGGSGRSTRSCPVFLTEISGEYKVGSHPTRLETRTKESNMYASRRVATKLVRRNESKVSPTRVCTRGDAVFIQTEAAASRGRSEPRSVGRTNQERTRWDPKDGDLCLARSKPGETLVEDRSDSDVQIDRRSWV